MRKPVKKPLLFLHHSVGLPCSGAGGKLAERDAAKESEERKRGGGEQKRQRTRKIQAAMVEEEGQEVKSGTDGRVDVGVTFEEERTYFTAVSFPLASRFHWFFETACESFALTDKPSQFITRLVVRRDDISLHDP